MPFAITAALKDLRRRLTDPAALAMWMGLPLALVTNPAQRILPGIIVEALKMMVEATFYAQRLIGPQVRSAIGTTSGTTGPSDDTVAAVSRAFNQRLRALQDTLLPPVLSLQS